MSSNPGLALSIANMQETSAMDDITDGLDWGVHPPAVRRRRARRNGVIVAIVAAAVAVVAIAACQAAFAAEAPAPRAEVLPPRQPTPPPTSEMELCRQQLSAVQDASSSNDRKVFMLNEQVKALRAELDAAKKPAVSPAEAPKP